MDSFHYLMLRDDCPPCPAPPPCDCAPNEQCVSTIRGCHSCQTNQCVPLDGSTSGSSHGVSAGAVAGAVIASIIFLAVVLLVFLWFRRRQRLLRTATAASGERKGETPARAEDVLNRPDPHDEKPTAPPPPQEMQRIYGMASHTTVNLDLEAHGDSIAATNGHARASTQSNPFADAHSIQSASTGTRSNVIPIALVGPASLRSEESDGPQRPDRSPDLNLSLDPNGQQNDSMLPSGKHYAKSTRSGMTAWRNSYMTTGSFASDLLNEAPVIVTPTRGTVKQVVGVVRAEVIRTPPSTSSVYSHDDTDNGPRTASSVNSRPPVPSPLASDSFGPLREEDEREQELSIRSDPFGDEHSPYHPDTPTSAKGRKSPAPTSATFGESQNWDPQAPRLPWNKQPRPSSVNTQAASIIDANIGTASRVHLGLDQLTARTPPMPAHTLVVPGSQASDLPRTPISAALSTPRSQYRMTSAKLVSPPTESTPAMPSGALETQQRRALEELSASRLSRSSVLSSTSTRADSILEAFPFVPPSPISDRPIRTPPRSPLAQQAFNNGLNTPHTPNTATSTSDGHESPLPPPNRKMLGMSTMSQSSTVSNGLGSFPFQIDSGNGPESADSSSPPSSFLGRQRASLDTLALTSDLSSYPLGFDRNEAMANYPGPKR